MSRHSTKGLPDATPPLSGLSEYHNGVNEPLAGLSVYMTRWTCTFYSFILRLSHTVKTNKQTKNLFTIYTHIRLKEILIFIAESYHSLLLRDKNVLRQQICIIYYLIINSLANKNNRLQLTMRYLQAWLS